MLVAPAARGSNLKRSSREDLLKMRCPRASPTQFFTYGRWIRREEAQRAGAPPPSHTAQLGACAAPSTYRADKRELPQGILCSDSEQGGRTMKALVVVDGALGQDVATTLEGAVPPFYVQRLRPGETAFAPPTDLIVVDEAMAESQRERLHASQWKSRCSVRCPWRALVAPARSHDAPPATRVAAPPDVSHARPT